MIVFRCAATPTLGMGHLVRCRSLAYELKRMGHLVAMIGPSLFYRNATDKQVFHEWIPRENWSSPKSDALLFLETYAELGAQFAVLDDYRINREYQNILRSSNILTLQFQTDFNGALNVDLIVNMNPAAKKEQYKEHSTADKSKFLLGASYAILRDEFIQRKPDNDLDGRILICFGAGSDRGAITFVLDSLYHSFSNPNRVLIVTGQHNPNNQHLRSLVDSAYSNIALEINPPNMADIYKNTKLMITAGGGATFEAAYFSIPMLLIATDHKQINQAKAWEKLGGGYFLGYLEDIQKTDIICGFNKLLKNEKPLKKNLSGLVDGLGTYRIATEITKLINRHFYD